MNTLPNWDLNNMHLKPNHIVKVGLNQELTKDILEKELSDGEIFAWGFINDSFEGINMTNSGKTLRWVAKRGVGFYDWAIYVHFEEKTIEEVASFGDKVYTEEFIKKLVNCTKEAFNLYRY